MSLFFAVLLSVLFLGEHLNAYEWAGVALIFSDALLIAFR